MSSHRHSVPITLTKKLTIVGSLLVCLAAAACDSDDSNSTNERVPPTERPPVVVSIDQVQTPFSRLFQTTAELSDEQMARTILLEKCTQSFGEPYVPEAASGVSSAFSPYRFGPVDARTVSQYGYHDPKDDTSIAYSQAHPVRQIEGKPTSKTILRGPTADEDPETIPTDDTGRRVPKGGCEATVDKELVPQPKNTEGFGDLLDEMNARIRQDPRVKSVIAQWATCMKKADHPFDGPIEPTMKYGGRPDVSSDEIATAVADVRCKQTTNYIGIRLAINTAYEQDSIDDHAEMWRTYGSWVEGRRAKVRRVLGSQG